MGRRDASRRRLGIRRETLRRLDSLRPDELRRVAGGGNTDDTTEVCLPVNLTYTCEKYRPYEQGRTNSKYCLSGDG